MPISKTSKIIIAALGTGGASGAFAYGYHSLTSETIKNKLGETLLSYKEKDVAKWKARATTLSTDNNENLSKDLKKIKAEKDADGSKVKGWCETNINNKFTSETDQIFLEVQKYCTYNIKDKLEKTIDIATWAISKHNQKLKELTADKEISDTMKEIKAKISKDTEPETDALKNWCKSSYEKPFKGNKDQDYLDAKEYCVDSTAG